MELTVDILKKPFFWAVAIPAVLLVWAIAAAAHTVGLSDDYKHQRDVTRQALSDADEIIRYQQKMGVSAAQKAFDPNLASVRECARIAGISDASISRGQSSKPERKEGTLLYRETYTLDSVNLLQVTEFIDAAERNYASVKCTQLDLTARQGRKNAWVANVGLQYLSK
jgi:hypothetical protein